MPINKPEHETKVEKTHRTLIEQTKEINSSMDFYIDTYKENTVLFDVLYGLNCSIASGVLVGLILNHFWKIDEVPMNIIVFAILFLFTPTFAKLHNKLMKYLINKHNVTERSLYSLENNNRRDRLKRLGFINNDS